MDDKAEYNEEEELVSSDRKVRRPGGLTQSGNLIPMPNAFPTDPTQHFNSP